MKQLDYQAPVQRRLSADSQRLLAYSCTAAFLCLAAVGVDYRLGFDADVARELIWIEGALAVCGLVYAVRTVGRGDLQNLHKVVLALCLFINGITLFVAIVGPRIYHD